MGSEGFHAALQTWLTGSPVLAALTLSVLAGVVLTGLGTLSVLAFGQLSEKRSAALLSFAAGVMLAASIFSLLLPGLELAETTSGSKPAAGLAMGLAVALGAAVLWAIHRYVPHEHFIKGCEGEGCDRLRRVWLFVLAITIHNLPEGMATGVAAASGDVRSALGVALGIGLQNAPEGLAVAAALLSQNYSRGTAIAVGVLSGVVEPVGAVLGAGAIALASGILPWGLGFAAGAMLYVISEEIIPETHRVGREGMATAMLFTGFLGMMYLDFTLG
jgi:ZIP family zinc transporter